MDEKPKPAPEFWTGERCFIRELLNDKARPGVSLALCRVTPGTTTELHALSVDEWYVVQGGTGLMRVGDRPPWTLSAGDSVHIPAHCAQQISNPGDNDLLFFCVCAPRFTPDCYTSLE